MPYFMYRQNNVLGVFKSPAVNVIIKADDYSDANQAAMLIGMNFKEVCCCGYRWNFATENNYYKTMEDLLEVKTRIGMPSINNAYKNMLEHPSFATSYGLLLYAIKNEKNDLLINEKDSSFFKILKKIKNFLGNFTKN